MKINQNTFRETRLACIVTIKIAWILEAVFVCILLFIAFGMLIGNVSSPFDSIPIYFSLLAVYFILFVSIVFTGFSTALMANAVVNIDSRNMQAKLFDMRISKQHKLPQLPKNTDSEFINLDFELSRIKAERVT